MENVVSLIYPEKVRQPENPRTNPARTPFLLVANKLDEGLGGLDNLAVVLLGLAELLLGELRRVGVEAEQDLLVVERVLLLDDGALGDGTTLDGAEHSLDFGAVDELANVGLLDEGRGEEEVLLESRRLSGGAVDLVQSSESGAGPDNEATEVTTRSELEEVEGIDRRSLNTGDVAEGLDEGLAILLGVVDDERTTALPVAPAPHLTLTSTELAGVLDLLDIGTGTDGLEQSKSGGGLDDGVLGESGGGNDEGNLGDGSDLVATGHQESSVGGGSQSRGGSETPGNSVRRGYESYIVPKTHFWFRLTFWCHFLQTLVGANIRPERHWLPKAA